MGQTRRWPSGWCASACSVAVQPVAAKWLPTIAAPVQNALQEARKRDSRSRKMHAGGINPPRG